MDDSIDFDTYLERIAERNVGRWDVPALFDDPNVLESVVEALAAPFRDGAVDAVVGIDALGFVLGSGVALELGVGFVPIRKGDKLAVPEADVRRRTLTDYSGEEKSLKIDAERVADGATVAIVDDWIDTGAQMAAATSLVEAAGGSVAGITVLDAVHTDRARTLAGAYDLHTLNPETTL